MRQLLHPLTLVPLPKWYQHTGMHTVVQRFLQDRFDVAFTRAINPVLERLDSVLAEQAQTREMVESVTAAISAWTHEQMES